MTVLLECKMPPALPPEPLVISGVPLLLVEALLLEIFIPFGSLSNLSGNPEVDQTLPH